jgi:hypothetical protein
MTGLSLARLPQQAGTECGTHWLIEGCSPARRPWLVGQRDPSHNDMAAIVKLYRVAAGVQSRLSGEGVASFSVHASYCTSPSVAFDPEVCEAVQSRDLRCLAREGSGVSMPRSPSAASPTTQNGNCVVCRAARGGGLQVLCCFVVVLLWARYR